jgi:hypothetical protein
MTMKALLRFLLSDPPGAAGDGRSIGIGLGAALRKHYSADDAERYLLQWSTEENTEHDSKSPRH